MLVVCLDVPFRVKSDAVKFQFNGICLVKNFNSFQPTLENVFFHHIVFMVVWILNEWVTLTNVHNSKPLACKIFWCNCIKAKDSVGYHFRLLRSPFTVVLLHLGLFKK